MSHPTNVTGAVENGRPPLIDVTSHLRIPRDPRIRAVLRALRSNLDLTVFELADSVTLSRVRLEQIVKKDLGISLRSWKREKQLKKAAGLLKQGSCPIKEVGYECGIPDPSNLSHAFRSRFGVCPTEYREAWRRRKKSDS